LRGAVSPCGVCLSLWGLAPTEAVARIKGDGSEKDSGAAPLGVAQHQPTCDQFSLGLLN
jgi:hypothetical protein